MINLGDAEKQRPEYYRPDSVPDDPISAFLVKLSEFGLLPGSIEASGKLVRFDVDKKGDKAGWYVFHLGDISGGAFGNWRTGLKEVWSSKDRRNMTDLEAEQYRKQIADAKRQRDKEQAEIHKAAKIRANDIWNRAESANLDHPYLIRKNVDIHGLKQSRGNLVLPVRDAAGAIHSLQFLKPDGEKKFLYGGKVDGHSFTIPGDNNLFICEGYSTGASIHKATGGTVICAFNAGNLPAVAHTVREHCPSEPITICADNDRFTPGNPGLKFGDEAAKAISAKLVYPVFEGLPGCDDPVLKYSDFNDLAGLVDISDVKSQIGETGQRGRLPPFTSDLTRIQGRILSRPKPLDFIFRFNDQGLIPRGVVGVLTATGGTGKTFFLLSLAMVGASAGNFGPINAPRPLNSLVIVGEDPQEELERRLWDIGKGRFPDRLHAASVYGELGPLMRLDGSTAVLADAYYWLEETIKNHPGLELLILDPKSRFYGLDENNSEHATRWIQSLETLAKKYSLTVLFSHHTSKDQSGRISQNMSRGSSAIVDGCRWQGGLVRMDRERAESLGIENHRQYILFDAPKSNYAADLPRTIVFKRGENGVLEYTEPGKDYLKKMSMTLLEMLKNDPVKYSKRELIERKEGREIAREMSDKHPGFKRGNDMKRVIEHLIKKDELIEVFEGNNRWVLNPVTPF